MVDVLLINAPVKNPRQDRHAGLNPPLGLAYIAAVLMQNRYSVTAIDFNLSGLNLARLQMVLHRENPKILGISAHTETYENALKIARIAKEYNPQLPVVMGGSHPTVMYHEVALEPDVDYIVRGEGEHTMLELVDVLLGQSRSVGSIKGIAFKEDGIVKATESRPLLTEPDGLPFPARELFPLHLYNYPGNLLMSRGGCPFNCAFCAVNNIWDGDRRLRSVDNVLAEIQHLFALGINEVNFADDTFTLNRAHVLKLCAELYNLKAPFPWGWTCSTRVDLVDKELLKEMYRAGCSSVQFGAETGSQEILDAIGKRITLNQVLEATRTALAVGLDVLCSFMFPHPLDTEETIHMQQKFMQELSEMGAKITMSLTTPYPGTFYYEHPDHLGMQILAERWADFDAKHLIILPKNLSKVKMEELLEETIQVVGLRQFQTVNEANRYFS